MPGKIELVDMRQTLHSVMNGDSNLVVTLVDRLTTRVSFKHLPNFRIRCTDPDLGSSPIEPAPIYTISPAMR